MICPKWLVQSSAIGMVGAALIAVPFWMNTATDIEVDEPRFQTTSIESTENIDHDAQRLLDRAVDHTEGAHRSAGQAVRNVRARQVRRHLVDTYQGPTCPRQFELRQAPMIEEYSDDEDKIIYDDALSR